MWRLKSLLYSHCKFKLFGKQSQALKVRNCAQLLWTVSELLVHFVIAATGLLINQKLTFFNNTFTPSDSQNPQSHVCLLNLETKNVAFA